MPQACLPTALTTSETARLSPAEKYVTSSNVDLAHAGAVAAGAELLHAPRVFPQYHPSYYATFFLDPDGFRIEVATARDARA